MARRTTLWLVTTVLPVAACGPTGQAPAVHMTPTDASAGTSTNAALGSANVSQAAAPVTAANVLPPGSALLDAKYSIDVSSFLGSMCSGDIEMKLNANLKAGDSAQLFQIPEGKIHCPLLGADLDLAQMIGAFASEKPPDVANPVVVVDNVISMKLLGLSTYDPPRPMLPSFIAGSKDALKSLDVTKQVTCNSTSDGKTGTGSMRVHMLSFGQPYKPPTMDRTFPNVLDFEVVITGYDSLNKVPNLLFDRMEFKISLDPISILYVAFDGTAAEYMDAASAVGSGTATGTDAGGGGGLGGLLGGGGGGGLGGLLGGGGGSGGSGGGSLFGDLAGLLVKGIAKLIQVHMEMNLESQQGLDTSAQAASSGTSTAPSADNAGETVGGKPTGN